jgi:hypothetical protein
MRVFILLSLAASMSVMAAPLHSTFDVVRNSKRCHEDQSTQQVECSFSIGNDLRIELAGVGTELASASFSKSNSNGDYFAKIGTIHHCIIIQTGARRGNEPDFAFISPRSAKVYRTWEECGSE